MKFSIIIPVRAINEFLEENISNIKKLQYAEFEVIIIVDKLESYDFEGDSRFKIIESGPIGPGEKRNEGAKISSGDILVFLDDDAYPASDWLLEASKIFENPEVYALGGPAMTPLDAKFAEKMSGRILESWLASANIVYRHLPKKSREIDDYPSVNLFVRKDAFWKVGGFSVEYWPGEDTKLCLDLVKYFKRKFAYSPMPVVFHHRRNVFLPHLKQISRYGRHRGQFARIFPETSRLPSYFFPSIFLLGLVFGQFVVTYIPALKMLYYSALVLYLAMLTVESVKLGIKDNSVKAGLYFMAGIFLTHVVYGVNFIIGVLKKPKLKLKAVDKATGNYSEG